MYKYFVNNLNISGKGGVAASPDKSMGYFFHWERDGALSMKAFMMINDYNLSLINEYMQQFVKFMIITQSESDPFGIDVIIEPKYYLPNGEVYQGAWCRPQNDGPGLDAITLIQFANQLLKGNQNAYVQQYLWTNNPNQYYGGLIKNHLEWIVKNYANSNTCDLWEEIQSTDFFWNKFTMRRAMLEGSKFAQQMGDSVSANIYQNTANQITNTLLPNHWTGNFIMESQNRQLDSAVILGLTDGYNNDNYLAPTSYYVANTVAVFNNYFCNAFSINSKDSLNKIPGVLYGRYQGDNFLGGNAWILCTASLAQLLYRGAIFANQNASLITKQDMDAWSTVFNVQTFNSTTMLSTQLFNAADAIMQRIYYHVKGNLFHLNEQINKDTGYEMGAYDLTWSYANVLTALKYREQYSYQYLLEKHVEYTQQTMINEYFYNNLREKLKKNNIQLLQQNN